MTRKTRIRLRKLCWKGIKLFKWSKGMKKNLSPGVKKISVPFPDLLNCLPSYLSLSNVSEKQKVYTNLFFFFFGMSHGMQDLSSPSRDRTCAPYVGGTVSPLWEVWEGHHQGSAHTGSSCLSAMFVEHSLCQAWCQALQMQQWTRQSQSLLSRDL